VLSYLISESLVSRDELFISSKGGMIHEDADYGVYSEEIIGNMIKSGQIEASDINDSNCIHPNFLKVQLEKSLSNLGIETLDCYSLNLPEVHLLHQDNPTFYKNLLVS
jgi:aryl-alcohol dehydrogenase-like predicted oxidoreductase